MDTETFGGRKLNVTPEAHQIRVAATEKVNFSGFFLWECFIGMQLHRNRAVKAWNRIQKIYKRIDNGEGKANMKQIMARVAALESEVLQEQSRFLDYERIAEEAWQELSPTDRRDGYASEWYSTSHTEDSILGLWRSPLGSCPVPPVGFKLNSTAIQFASPAQGRIYSNHQFR